jgi:hypothetical protein
MISTGVMKFEVLTWSPVLVDDFQYEVTHVIGEVGHRSQFPWFDVGRLVSCCLEDGLNKPCRRTVEKEEVLMGTFTKDRDITCNNHGSRAQCFLDEETEAFGFSRNDSD